MSATVATREEAARPWLLTPEALQRLVDEITQLRLDVASLADKGMEDGIVRLPAALAAGRLKTLNLVLERAELAGDPTCAAIGRRVTLRDESGETISYRIVFPGDGNPAQGWVSADSPLGAAILGATPGMVVEVVAPAGRWPVTIVAVD